jgi:hypothetical protein
MDGNHVGWPLRRAGGNMSQVLYWVFAPPAEAGHPRCFTPARQKPLIRHPFISIGARFLLIYFALQHGTAQK